MTTSDDLPDFVTALRAVAPHMSKEETLPILAGVLVHDGKLIATDRYSVARASFAPIGDLKPKRKTDVFLVRDLVQFILARRARDEVTNVKVAGDVVTVSFESGITYTPPSFPLYGVDGKSSYPPIDQILDEFEPATAESPAPTKFMLGREHLGKWSVPRAGGSNYGGLLIEPDSRGNRKPVRLSTPSLPWLESLLVPVRFED